MMRTRAIATTAAAVILPLFAVTAPAMAGGHSGPPEHSGPTATHLRCTLDAESNQTIKVGVIDRSGSGPVRYGYRMVTYHTRTILCNDGLSYTSKVRTSRGPVVWL